MTTRDGPHHVDPTRQSVRLLLCYKNFAASKGISHIGLGVAASCNQATLRRMGYWVEVMACQSSADIASKLDAAKADAASSNEHPISHVVISAPWVPTPELQGLLIRYPQVDFAVVSHSNVGFLAADPGGIQRMKDAVGLQVGYPNFRCAGNCQKFADAWSAMHGQPVLALPNLYDLYGARAGIGQRAPWSGSGPLRVGAFGAERPLKNLVSAAGAAIELGTRLKVDVEFWVSSGRTEGAGSTGQAVQAMFANLPHAKLKQSGWQSWPAFRQVVRGMHVLLNVSYTESFNMVTADGIAEGVASVCSDAIDWVPQRWYAKSDDVGSIADTAVALLHDTNAVSDGQVALSKYVSDGSALWEKYLLTGGGK